MESYETDIALAPQVEREYLDLNRDHENSLKSYQDIKAKQLDARVSQEMEKDSKGERFSLIDPPDLPQKPHSPNRPAILFLGLILSLGGGLGYAGIRESMDSSVKSARGLAGLLSAPLLSVIPYMENVADRRKKSLFRLSLVVMVLVAIVVALLLINWLWMPLDVLWYSLLRKLGM
jgi:capsular polysaccharide biosynthesis protein